MSQAFTDEPALARNVPGASAESGVPSAEPFGPAVP